MTWYAIDLAVKSGLPLAEVVGMDEFTRGILLRYLMKRAPQ